MITVDAEHVGPWVCSKLGIDWIPGSHTAIGKIKNGSLCAGVLYEKFTGTNVTLHIAGENNWPNREFLWMIFDYPFNQLGVKRVTAPIASTNGKAITLVKSMGFDLECKLSQAIPDGDLLLFCMFKEQCKYLRGRYDKAFNARST